METVEYRVPGCLMFFRATVPCVESFLDELRLDHPDAEIVTRNTEELFSVVG